MSDLIGNPSEDRLSHVAAQVLFIQERHAAKTVGDMKQFVTKLPHLQQARTSLATRKLYRKVPKFSEARNFAVLHLKF